KFSKWIRLEFSYSQLKFRRIEYAVSSESNDSSTSINSSKSPSETSSPWWSLICGLAIMVMAFQLKGLHGLGRSPFDPEWQSTPAPLVMQGGDPYLRALMRTISASESNSSRPYSLLYGGEHIQNLSHHPDICVPIVAGPNVGDCTTAAGRYQMLTSTWLSKAEEYHPQKNSLLFWDTYSFEPEFQDEVVYRWLSDSSAWGGTDLSQELREGKLQEVLRLLSPTWTSLGYGIEDNAMSSSLPEIYNEVLQEELKGQG
ncbi:MAG TPA: glycoside hydrolase family protein, partial [Coleofasciculaceae cyanobacterium]